MCVCVCEFLSILHGIFYSVEDRRQLRANDDEYNNQFKYVVSESKFQLQEFTSSSSD